MPRGDRRGPDGYGPMTGRGLGYCAGYPHPGYAAPAPPMGGGGFGRGRGRGYRHMYYATGQPAPARTGYYPTPSREEEIEALREYARDLQEEVKAVEDQINELEADDEKE